MATQRHADTLQDAPPGISYRVATGTHQWSSSKKIATTSQHVQTLRPIDTGRAGKVNPRSAAAVLGVHQRLVGGFGYQNITTTSAYGTQYAVDAHLGGHQVSLIIDTGSADTWAVQKNFHCIDYSGVFLPRETCGFGETYLETFQYGFTDPETHMYIQYGDGEIVTGPMGFSDVTVGNVTVKKQQVCLANTTYWYGNNQTSGLIGLAFPSLTNAYLGDGEDHDFGNQVQYSPLFTSMVSQGLVDPIFSIAIDRNASSGMLAFGGIAPVSGLDLSRTAVLDMIIVSSSHGTPHGQLDQHLHRVRPASFPFPQPLPSTRSTRSSQMVGTTTRLPTLKRSHTLSTAAQRSTIFRQVRAVGTPGS